MSHSFLQVQQLAKRFASKHETLTVFEHINFTIEKGEFVCIIGHSGCGKSTIMNTLAGLDVPSEGVVIMDGREISGPSLERGVVFQNYSLLPWLTALDNVMFGVRARWPKWRKDQIREHSLRYLTMVGLQGVEQRKPAQLSGGMRQRVSIARAFATQPKLLLLDEPFGALDALTRGLIQDELVTICTETRQTVFMITHDIDEAILLSDRILLMSNGPGAVIAESVVVDLPKPRKRADIIYHPGYYSIRNHLVEFLVNRSKTVPQESPSNALPIRVNNPLSSNQHLLINWLMPEETTMKKQDVVEAIVIAKQKMNLTWDGVAASIGMSPVWTTSVCLGMNSASEDKAEALCKLFDLPEAAKMALMQCPTKTWGDTIPQDPLIYRLYEMIGVYGPTIKEIIHEKFGDGIMSAIDFSMDIGKEENPKGDRVIINLNGKFLPYKAW